VQTATNTLDAEMTRLLDARLTRGHWTEIEAGEWLEVAHMSELEVTEAFRVRGIAGTSYLVQAMYEPYDPFERNPIATETLQRLGANATGLDVVLRATFRELQVKAIIDSSLKWLYPAERTTETFRRRAPFSSYQRSIFNLGSSDPELVILFLNEAARDDSCSPCGFLPVTPAMAPAAKAAMAELAAATRHPNATVRSIATSFLLCATPDSPEANALLIPLLRDPDEYVRQQVGYMLHKLSGPEEVLVPAMIYYRQHTDHRFRQQMDISGDTLLADLAYRFPSTISRIVAELPKTATSQARVALLGSLAEMGHAAASSADALLPYLDSEDELTRIAACHALLCLTGEHKREQQLEQMRSSWNLRNNPLDWRWHYWDRLSARIFPSAEDLTKFTNPDPKIRLDIARQYNQRDAFEGSRVYPKLRQLLQDPEPDVRKAAQAAIQSIDDAYNSSF